MNISVLTYSQPLNHTSSDSGPLPRYEFDGCKDIPHGLVFSYLVMVFNLVVGFPANVMVMWQIVRKKSDSTSDIFIFNLAVLDAYFCLMTIVELVNRLLLNNKYLWYFMYFAYGMKDTTPLFLTCICLDRYMAVVHPIVFSSIRDNKIRVALSMLVWGLMLAYALSKAVLGREKTDKVFTGLILATFTIMVFCNLSIIWILRKSVMGKEKMHPMKKKALRIVVITLAIIVFNFLPPVAIFPFTEYFNPVDFKCVISMTVYSIINLSSSTEPLLYISKMEHLPCLAKIPCCCFKSPSQEQDNVRT